MQYVIYFLVATPLVVAWLFWAAAVTPPQPPMFNMGYNNLQSVSVLPAAPRDRKITNTLSNRKG
jgi:hypothetical protein